MGNNNTTTHFLSNEDAQHYADSNLRESLIQKMYKDLYILNDQDHYTVAIGAPGYSINDFKLTFKKNYLIVNTSKKSLFKRAINWKLKEEFRRIIKVPKYNFKGKVKLDYNGRILKVIFSKQEEQLIFPE